MDSTNTYYDLGAPSIKIISSYSFFKRIFILIKNPFTYVFKGYLEF